MEFLIGRETTVVELLPSGDQMKNNAGQFVRGSGDGFWSVEFGSHASIEVPEGAFAVMKGLCRHPQRSGGPALDFLSADPKHCSSTDVIVGA
jgi:hypothetical protein